MKTPAPLPDEEEELPVRRLTAEEARQLREKQPSVPLWRVLAMQMLVGLVMALAAWGFTGKPAAGWSAGYGALAVVLPAALFARGLTGGIASLNPVTAVMGFFVWEMVKIALTVAMLFAAPRLVNGLSWPAMLVGLVVTMQVYWIALFLAPRQSKH